jgi:hypothetical protein
MADYLKEHRIDCVVFIGGVDYFGETLPREGGQ